jgi:hypothetical protein
MIPPLFGKQEVGIWRPKSLPTIWHTYMKLVTKYQISGINSCWEKCDEKWAYMFNVYKNQLSRQTGSRNLTGPKTLPTIWYTYMKLVTKNQISAINSYWEKCDEKYLGQTEGQTDRGKTVYLPPPSGSGGITRGTARRRSPTWIHKRNNLTVRYAGLIPPASPSS